MNKLNQILDVRPDLQPYLFCRGFLITNHKIDISKYPFYGHWRETEISGVFFYVHRDKKMWTLSKGERVFFLIGHAYDPFQMISDENTLLTQFADSDSCWEETNGWTGIYCVGKADGGKVSFTTDAAGQQLVYYGIIGGRLYITSHSQLVGELEDLEQPKYIEDLKRIRYFHAFGYVLPGDLSPFIELKRAQCNFFIEMSCDDTVAKRFWPTSKIEPSPIIDMGSVIHNNLLLIANKWPNRRAAISVTGGMDSKTTMACTNGIYDKFRYFSYDSLPDEKVDADAAHDLCGQLGLKHIIYTIPVKDAEIADFDIWNEILYYNCGCIGYSNPNDVRKRAFLSQVSDFDIEIKSWVDEIGRARYHKKYAKRSFPSKLTPRYFSSLYKPFITERRLLRETDRVFKYYLKNYYGDAVFDLVPWWDLIYWEFEWNAAEGAFLTGEHLVSYDITIPYNNRKLLAMMLATPLEMRINDEIQKQIIREMNVKIEETGINIVDISHTKRRAQLERAYLEVNTRIPF